MNFQNYSALLFVIPFYGGLMLLIFVPPPLGLYLFLVAAASSFILVGGTPTYAGIVQRNFKQAWVQASNDESFWTYPGRFQWWYKKNPTHKWLEATKEWLTIIPLDKPFAHPHYNKGKKALYFAFVLHSIEGVLSGMDLSGFSEEEKKAMGSWENLSPKHGGAVWFMGYVFNNASSDWFDVDEVMPDRKTVEIYKAKTPEERAKETPITQVVLNHLPIIVGDKAHPLYRMTNCVNSFNLRKQVKERRLALARAIVR